MKNGHKHKTGIIGADSEAYCSRLFKMAVNPQGSRRPDLVSINGQFNPRLSIELKSGRKNKGVLVDYQLHYAVTTWDDYVDIFGEEPISGKGFLPGVADEISMLRRGDVAYYYCILNRADDITSDDIDRPFSRIKLDWGNAFFVPGEFGKCAFAVSRHMRTRESMGEIDRELSDLIKRDITEGASHYLERKGHKQSWQNIHARDVSAIFFDDLSLTTEPGKERVELLWKHYPQLAKLRKVEIAGPNNTGMYALVEPEHLELFDTQVRQVVDERKPIIESVTRERKRARRILERVKPRADYGLFSNGIDEGNFSLDGLTKKEVERLRRLTMWMARGERMWDELPEVHDDIPF